MVHVARIEFESRNAFLDCAELSHAPHVGDLTRPNAAGFAATFWKTVCVVQSVVTTVLETGENWTALSVDPNALTTLEAK